MWREELERQVIWLNDTGMDHSTIVLERVGPLFRVEDHGEAGYEAWAGRMTWHLTYNGADREFIRRIIKVRMERNLLEVSDLS